MTSMPPPTPSNVGRLHGVTLAAMVTYLSENMGWESMAVAIPIRCFTHDPSIKSSLVFLRRTPWARQRLEELYLDQRREAGELGKS